MNLRRISKGLWPPSTGDELLVVSPCSHYIARVDCNLGDARETLVCGKSLSARQEPEARIAMMPCEIRQLEAPDSQGRQHAPRASMSCKCCARSDCWPDSPILTTLTVRNFVEAVRVDALD